MRNKVIVLFSILSIIAGALLVSYGIAHASTVRNTEYCWKDTASGITFPWVGSSPNNNGDVPMNSHCYVQFIRINYANYGGQGFYEYQVVPGDVNAGSCLRENVGSGSNVHPMQNYFVCGTGDSAVQREEEITDSGIVHYESDAICDGEVNGSPDQLWAQSAACPRTFKLVQYSG